MLLSNCPTEERHMAAPKPILAKPDDHRGILAMSEAVDAMLEAFRNWAKDPLVGELRRRTHTPKNVRITLHQGGAPAYGTTGIMTHAELVRIFGEKQKYPRRGRPVLVLYDSDSAALKLILVGEMHPRELPDANSVVAMPTACASMVGTDLLARKDCKSAGVFGAGDQARLHLLALTCIRKSIKTVRVFSPTEENRKKFATEMTAVLGIEVIAAHSPAAVVNGADVIICATNSNIPVFDGNWLVPGQHVTSIVSSNIGLLKRGFVNEMRREIDDRTLERADILMTNVWGQEELDKTAVFWEASLDRPIIARKIVDAAQVIRGEKSGRTDDSQITYFKNCAFWGIGAAAIGGLIYDKLSKQGKGLALDFDAHEFYDDSWTEE
jgi:ornithine cyclodeaminase/alanine dehydrogenase-like protein (mu-crystallin family)